MPSILAQKFDRAEILREAHAETRQRMAPSASFRYGDRWSDAAGGYIPESPYRVIFAARLRAMWRAYKTAADDAAYEASLPPIPADIAERARQMVANAWYEPISAAGNERYSAMLAEASLMRDAARAA